MNAATRTGDDLARRLADRPGGFVPLPPGDPRRVAAAVAGRLGDPFATGFLYRSREGETWVGLGSAPGNRPAGLVLEVGPFDPGDPRDPGPWRPAGRLPSPRWLLRVGPGSAHLAWSPGGGSDRPDREELAELFRPPPSLPPRPSFSAPAPARIRPLVEEARAAVRRGVARKLVPSVPARLELPVPPPPGALAARLAAAPGNDGRTRYAVLREGRLLLGATPERLFRLRGNLLETEALAGTALPGREDALLASGKDREEHAWVVHRLREALRELVADPVVPPRPGLLRLPGLVHLRTPLRGTLRPGIGPGEALAALHPTPAVAGEPPAAARAWLRDHELPRGAFAGPLLARARGTADCAVILRSAVLEGAVLHLRAGAGIVPASEPSREAEEIRAKLRATLAGLWPVDREEE